MNRKLLDALYEERQRLTSICASRAEYLFCDGVPEEFKETIHHRRNQPNGPSLHRNRKPGILMKDRDIFLYGFYQTEGTRRKPYVFSSEAERQQYVADAELTWGGVPLEVGWAIQTEVYKDFKARQQ